MTFGPTIRNGVSVSVGATPSLGTRSIVFPPDISSGLTAWYRYGVGITSSGGSVSAWTDQSGAGNNLTQGAATNQPTLNADNSITFDGVDNYMQATFSLAQPATIVILAKQESWTSDDRIFDGKTVNTGSLQQITSSPRVRPIAVGGAGSNANWLLQTYACVTTQILNGTGNSYVVINNATPVAAGDINSATNLGGLTLGARGDATRFAHVTVKEVIVYAAALNAFQRAQLVRYMSYVNGSPV